MLDLFHSHFVLSFYVLQLLVDLNTSYRMRIEKQVLVFTQMSLHQLFVAMILRAWESIVELRGLQGKSVSH